MMNCNLLKLKNSPWKTFLDMILKPTAIKKWSIVTYQNLEILCKTLLNEGKATAQTGRKIFAKYVSDNGFISKIYHVKI